MLHGGLKISWKAKVMISVVVPVYNELPLLCELRARTVKAMESAGESFEIIFVDDGSRDGSLQVLMEFHREDPRLKVIELSRNFGHQSAISAGLEQANGEYVAVMDGDLQDPPELIPIMMAKLRSEDLDVVNAKRATRGERLFRKLMANLFHYVFSRLSEIRSHGSFGNFCLLNRKSLEALRSFPEEGRYLPGLRSYMGFRQGSIPYDREPRKAGRTKMSAGRLLRLAADAFLAFSHWPVKLCLSIGLLGTMICLVLAIVKITQPGVSAVLQNTELGAIALFMLGFVQLTFIGILGEYLFRTYRESLRRPVYFIRNRYLG